MWGDRFGDKQTDRKTDGWIIWTDRLMDMSQTADNWTKIGYINDQMTEYMNRLKQICFQIMFVCCQVLNISMTNKNISNLKLLIQQKQII